jgi:NAD(P)-dependent dehydrogenase (short-subunit alcohol dehydrogenase family)
MNLLEGRAAIVTGAASGIGAASARLFAEHGASVLAVDLAAERLEAEHAGRDGVQVLAQDVTAPEAPERIVGRALELFGQLDILYNNAGVSGEAPEHVPHRRYRTKDTPDDFWRQVLEINLNSGFRLTKAALPHLRSSRAGRVIGTSSVMADFTDVGLGAYATSKAAMRAFLRTVAVEEGKYGVTANWIEPGAIYTPMTRVAYDQAQFTDPVVQRISLRRLGQPIDVARGALFLASDLAEYVTGQGLRIDGGMFLRVPTP